MVVFLTDGENDDHSETQQAYNDLKQALRGVNSKFNVIGFGNKFNVEIL